MGANNGFSSLDNQIMNNTMSEVRALNWAYIITNIVTLIKRSLVSDDAVHPAIKDYLLNLSKEQFDCYFLYRIDSDHTLHSCSEGRTILKRYKVVKTTAHAGMLSAGVSDNEASLYDVIAYLTDPRSYGLRVENVETQLMHNYERGFFKQLYELCVRYQYKAEAQLLKNLMELLGVYQEQEKIRRRAEVDCIRKELEEEFGLKSKSKSWFSRFKEAFS